MFIVLLVRWFCVDVQQDVHGERVEKCQKRENVIIIKGLMDHM